MPKYGVGHGDVCLMNTNQTYRSHSRRPKINKQQIYYEGLSTIFLLYVGNISAGADQSQCDSPNAFIAPLETGVG